MCTLPSPPPATQCNRAPVYGAGKQDQGGTDLGGAQYPAHVYLNPLGNFAFSQASQAQASAPWQAAQMGSESCHIPSSQHGAQNYCSKVFV